MQAQENNELFNEISAEDSAVASGGAFAGGFSLDKYIFGLGAAFLFGNPGITPDETQHVWENSLYGTDTVLGPLFPKF
jgi:hypothetical protein